MSREIPSRPCESQRTTFTALGFESADTEEPSLALWQRNGVTVAVPALQEFDIPAAADFLIDFAFASGVTHQAQRLMEALRNPRPGIIPPPPKCITPGG